MEETVEPRIGIQPPLEGDEEAPASILSGLVILNICKVLP